MLNIKRFKKGIKVEPTTLLESDAKGEIEVDNGSGKLNYHDGTSRSPVVTESSTSTLENKTIDADSNTISNIEVDNFKAGVIDTDDTLAAADDLKIPTSLTVKNYVDSQIQTKDQASEISVAPVGNLTADDVQEALEDHQLLIDSLVTLSGVAANSDDLGTFTGTTIADASTVKQALQSLETAHETLSGAQTTTDGKVTDLITLSGVAANAEDLGTFTGSIIPDSSTIKAAAQALETELETHTTSTEAHGATGAVVGTTNTQTLTNKTLTGSILEGLTLVENYISEESEDSSISGASAVIASPTKPIVRLTNASLISVTGISALESSTFGGVLTVVNATGNDVDILNNVGVATEAILTGTDDDITLSPDAAILLKYDTVTNKYRIIGGTGSGSVIIKALAGENLSAREAVYLSVGAADSGRTAGSAYKLDASNDNRIEYVGLVKATVTSGQTAKIITGGVVKGFTGLSVGVPVYLDTITPGAYTQTEPTTSQRWIIRLGIAISSTQVMILQDQGMTAFFNEEVQADITINNNVSSPDNVSNLVFDGAVANRFIVDYGLFRSTDTVSLAQAGRLRGVYNEDDAQWYLSDDYSGQNAGVTFSITAGGQIQYTSSNLAGTGYVGTLQYRISIGDGVHVLGVMEADGDLITRISGVNARLPIGAAGTAVVSNGTLPVYGYPAQLSTASGSAPSYAARAWVNFNGSTAAIRAAGNVTSITKNGTGDYTINFTTAMSDANYASCGIVGGNNSASNSATIILNDVSILKTTSAVRVVTESTSNGVAQDYLEVSLVIFR